MGGSPGNDEVGPQRGDPVGRVVDAMFRLSDLQQAQQEHVAELATVVGRQQGELAALRQAAQEWATGAARLGEHEAALAGLLADLRAAVGSLSEAAGDHGWQRTLAAALERTADAEQRAARLETRLAEQAKELARTREAAAAGEQVRREADTLRAELDHLRARLADLATHTGPVAGG